MKVFFEPLDPHTTGNWNFYAYHASTGSNSFYVHNNAVFVAIDQINKDQTVSTTICGVRITPSISASWMIKFDDHNEHMINNDGRIYWVNAIGNAIHHSRINNEYEGIVTDNIEYIDYTNHTMEKLKITLPDRTMIYETIYARIVINNKLVPNMFYYINDEHDVPQLYQLYYKRVGKFLGQANSTLYQPMLLQLTFFTEYAGAIKFSWLDKANKTNELVTYCLRPNNSFFFKQENNCKIPTRTSVAIDKPVVSSQYENTLLFNINNVVCPVILSKEE